MAELNYRERPSHPGHAKIWDRLIGEKPLVVLSRDYDGSWLAVFKDLERRYLHIYPGEDDGKR